MRFGKRLLEEQTSVDFYIRYRKLKNLIKDIGEASDPFDPKMRFFQIIKEDVETAAEWINRKINACGTALTDIRSLFVLFGINLSQPMLTAFTDDETLSRPPPKVQQQLISLQSEVGEDTLFGLRVQHLLAFSANPDHEADFFRTHNLIISSLEVARDLILDLTTYVELNIGARRKILKKYVKQVAHEEDAFNAHEFFPLVAHFSIFRVLNIQEEFLSLYALFQTHNGFLREVMPQRTRVVPDLGLPPLPSEIDTSLRKLQVVPIQLYQGFSTDKEF